MRSVVGVVGSLIALAVAGCGEAAAPETPGDNGGSSASAGTGVGGTAGAPASGGTGASGAPAGAGGSAGTNATGGAANAGAAGTAGAPPPGGGAGGESAAAGTGGATATGPGLNVGGKCFPPCAFPEITDPDAMGAVDGYGWEGQQACIDPASPAAMSATPCEPPAPPVVGSPGEGGVWSVDEMTCTPFCSSTATDPDAEGVTDGWGYEHQRSCVVPGTAAALGGLPCDPMLPALPTGDGVEIDDMGTKTCHPLCIDLAVAMPDTNGWGYEYERTCIVSGSVAALQGIPCDGPDPPEPPEPLPPPPGVGWNSDYTATMFGEDDCRPFGFDDPGNSNLNQATCIGSGRTQLNDQNRVWFGAVGDLSTLWSGGQCTCSNGSTDTCSSPPSCSGQGNCGQCVEVTCNGDGTYSYEGDGYTHTEFCKPSASVVVQLIDACPHNHPNNPYWCTTDRPNHIDISCSAFDELVQGERPIGEIGFINVHVRQVDCSVGLGPKVF